MAELEDKDINELEDQSSTSSTIIINDSDGTTDKPGTPLEVVTTDSIRLESEPLKKKKKKFPAGKGIKKILTWIWRKLTNLFAIRRIDRFILKKFLGTSFMPTVLMPAVISMFD
ncbi:MAG: hypothetical protein K2L89_00755, partial [Muribaculaceae bacterium]|nr:hypothetical protein [Muribaculaceae bacterium]